jgi:hypothetical protein
MKFGDGISDPLHDAFKKADPHWFTVVDQPFLYGDLILEK